MSEISRLIRPEKDSPYENGYLCGTPELLLTLGSDRTNLVKWWVDGSHEFYPNYRGHMGETQSLGKVFFISTPTKKNIINRSSTDTELVAADDIMTHAIWTSYFLD